MKRRVALWALVGFAVACGWAMVALATAPALFLNDRFFRTLAEITCPIAVVGKFVPLKYYAVIAINAATYALLGLALEPFRSKPKGVSN
jgi:hypothetical protein